jgi:hypothetical protein
MPPTTPKLLLIDPLTLTGREALRLLDRFPELGSDVQFAHTRDDEHQIAEAFGEPALVPPLDSAEQISADSALLVTSDADTGRIDHLLTFIEQHPETPVVDASRLDRLQFAPSLGHEDHGARQLRVPHPSMVAASAVCRPLRHLTPRALHVVAIDPVSTGGQEAIETLARQAVVRLNGGDVEELIAGNVLAFNLVVPDETSLAEEAVLLFPDRATSADRILSGHFHGHLAHIAATFADPIDDWELRDAWDSAPLLAVTDPPLRLDQTVDCEQVLVGPPTLADGGRHLSVTAVMDGLIIGGALTALELLTRTLDR